MNKNLILSSVIVLCSLSGFLSASSDDSRKKTVIGAVTLRRAELSTAPCTLVADLVADACRSRGFRVEPATIVVTPGRCCGLFTAAITFPVRFCKPLGDQPVVIPGLENFYAGFANAPFQVTGITTTVSDVQRCSFTFEIIISINTCQSTCIQCGSCTAVLNQLRNLINDSDSNFTASFIAIGGKCTNKCDKN